MAMHIIKPTDFALFVTLGAHMASINGYIYIYYNFLTAAVSEGERSITLRPLWEESLVRR